MIYTQLKNIYFVLILIGLLSTNTLATIVGTTKGNINISNGSASYTLPIITPKGVSGLKPSLNINYNSSNNVNAILGVGFSLSGLSSISKCNQDLHSDDYDNIRDYDYCLDGQKLLLVDNTKIYGSVNSEYQLEINNHSKIVKLENSWKIYTKDGLIKEYGNSTDSKDDDVFYRVDQIKDRFNNKITFKYFDTNDQKYIKQISYSNNTIDFIYENREDKENLYSKGIKITFHQRLKTILIKTNNQEVSTYNLTYNYINHKSRIISFEECSQGECLEPLDFNWSNKENDTPLASTNSLFNNEDSVLKDWSIYTKDINGDNLPDLIQSYKGTNGHELKVSLNTGTVFKNVISWFKNSDTSLKDWEIYLQDINGDSLPDLIQSYKGTNGHKFKVSLNNKSGFNTPTIWLNRNDSNLKDWNIYLQDVNSDSLPDLVQSYKGSLGHKIKVSLNTGTTFAIRTTWLTNLDSSLKDWDISLLDINGDGLLDIVQSYKGTDGHKFKVSLNNGIGFKNSTIWYTNNDSSLKDWNIYTQDINGDSLPDLIQSYKGTNGHKFKISFNDGIKFIDSTIWYNSGDSSLKDWDIYAKDINGDSLPDLIQSYKGTNGHKFKVSLNNGISFDESIYWINDSDALLKDYDIYTQDINGDLFPDLIQSYKGTNGHKFKVSLNNDKYLKIKTITNHKDQTININYTTLRDTNTYTHLTNSTYPQLDIKSNPMQIVKSIYVNDAVGGKNTISYNYTGFKIDIKKSSLGFKEVTTTNHTSNIKSITTFNQVFPLVGVQTSSKTFIDGIEISNSTNTIEVNKYYQNKNILNLENTQTITNQYDIKGDYLFTSITNNSNFDKYGNIGTIQTITKDTNTNFEKITTSTYTNNETNWILSRLIKASVKHIHNDTSTITRTSAFTYDTTTGTLISEIIEPSSSMTLYKSYTYDERGNKISQSIYSNEDDKQTTNYTYDAEYKNIVQIINALGHTQISQYNLNNQLIKLTDINNLITTLTYDTMGRKIKQTNPDNTTTTWEHSWDNSIENSLYKVIQTSTSTPPITIYYNKHNKVLRTIKLNFDGLKIYEDNIYNNQQQLIKSTMPYEATDTIDYIQNTYDKLGRQIKQTRQSTDGQTISNHFTYNKFTTTTTNAKGLEKTVINNILNQKIKVIEQNTHINYKYDAIGNLIQTTDSKNNTIVLRYDIYGNKTYQNDPDMGVWIYQYNPFKQLIKQIDAKGQITTITYDILGRITQRTQPEGTTTFTYDTSPNAKGKLYSSSKDNYKKEHYYDKLSRLRKTNEHIDNKIFTTKYTYTKDGKLNSTIYPNNFELINEYNQIGYLSALKSPKENKLNLTNIKLKELIQTSLDKKTQAFNNIIKLNIQIQTYKLKALQFLDLSNQYKDIDTPIYNQLIQTANFLIKTSMKLKKQAITYETTYNKNKQQLNYYLIQLQKSEDEYIYKWLIDTYSSQTTTLITQALSQIQTVTNIINQITTDKHFEIYEEIIRYYIQEIKTIIYEAKDTIEQYKNYKQKYKTLSDDKTYTAMFDDTDYKYYYKILKADTLGRVTKSYRGNGLVTAKTYNKHTGHLTHITTGYNDNNDIRDIQYQYDKLNNLTQKQDHKQNITQTYLYDNLDRVISSTTQTTTTNQTLTYNYNEIGNITHKSDVGNYIYNILKPHQVIKAGTNNYTYDANGNVIKKNNTIIQYNSYNKPILLQNDNTKTQFFYNTNKSRYKKILNNNTTYYINKYYEEEYTSKSIIQKNFIYAGNELIAVFTKEDDGRIILPQTQYFHKDSLGSIDTITNQSGVVLQRLSYKPFGEQVVQDWINQSHKKPLVKRGFTGHEHIEEHNFIHMNARIYDPVIGRFLSADTLIPYMYNTQSFNRYSYVRNNPLKYIDPSGHWGFSSFFKPFKKIVKAVKKVVKKVVKVVKKYAKVIVIAYLAYVTGGLALQYAATTLEFGALGAAMFSGAAAGFVGGVLSTKLYGGTWSQAMSNGLKGAVVGAASAGAAYGVAEGTASFFDSTSKVAHSSSFFNGNGGYDMATFKAVAHGVSRVAIAKAQNNKTSSAFWSGFVSSGFAASKSMGREVGTVVTSIISGTTSKISGGKFANGAVTGAFIHLFNANMYASATKRALYLDQTNADRQRNGILMTITVEGAAKTLYDVTKYMPFKVTRKLSIYLKATSKSMEYLRNNIDKP